jgi:hypothetical protein
MKKDVLAAAFSFVLVAISFFIFTNAIDLTVRLSETQRLAFLLSVVGAYIVFIFVTTFYHFRFSWRLPSPEIRFEVKRLEVFKEPKPSIELLSELAVYEIKRLETEHEEELERNQELSFQLKTLADYLAHLSEKVREKKISETIAPFAIVGVLSYVEDIRKQLKSREEKEKVRARIPMKDLLTQIIKKLLR